MAKTFKLKVGRLTPQEHAEFISELALVAVQAAHRAEGFYIHEPRFTYKCRHNV